MLPDPSEQTSRRGTHVLKPLTGVAADELRDTVPCILNQDFDWLAGRLVMVPGAASTSGWPGRRV
jgi:hypothetical protein